MGAEAVVAPPHLRVLQVGSQSEAEAGVGAVMHRCHHHYHQLCCGAAAAVAEVTSQAPRLVLAVLPYQGGAVGAWTVEEQGSPA